MCVVVYKPKGAKIPSEALIKHLWSKNSDGGGFCYPKGGQIVGYKGFMKAEEFIKAMREHLQRKVPALIHFRIATHGGKLPGGTHPFPATHDTNELKKLRWKSAFGIAHNGVVVGYGDRTATGLSDTQAFIKEILHDELILNGLFMSSHSLALRKLIKSEITTDRVAIMRRDGKVALLGDWHEGYSMLFSNKDYRHCTTRSAKKIARRAATYQEKKRREERGETENCYEKIPDRNKGGGKNTGVVALPSSTPPTSSRITKKCPNCGLWAEYTFMLCGITCCNLCANDVIEKTIDINKPEKPEVCSAAEICYPNEDSGSIIREMIAYGFQYCAVFGVWLSEKEVCADCRYLASRDNGRRICKVLDDPDIELSVPLQNVDQAVMDAVLEDVTLEMLGGYDMMTQAAVERTINEDEAFDYGESQLTPEARARIDAMLAEAEDIKRGGCS